MSTYDRVTALAHAADLWDMVVAEDRPRTQVGTGVDAVIRAQRRR